jgi:uncharacterized protein (TIRG00374 family)
MKGHRWKTLIGLLITVGLLWWAFHDVSAREVLAQVRQANIWWVLAAVVLATTSFLLRAVRWRILLLPAYPDIGFNSRFGAVAIGFMVNNLLPARLGEFARAFSLSRVEPIGVSAGFASVVVERVFDGIILALCVFVALASPGFPVGGGAEGGLVRGTATAGGAVFGLGLVVLWLLARFPKTALSLFEKTIGRVLPPHLTRRGTEILASFIGGLGALHDVRLFARAMLWSLAIWIWLAASMWCGMLAFGVTGPGPMGALFLQGLIGFMVAIPSSPGFFGPFEAAARLGLLPYGVDANTIISFATTYHITTFVPITLIGLWYLRRLGLSWSEVGHSEEIVESAVDDDEPPATRVGAGNA